MSAWTQAEDAVLRTEWKQGHTASLIARMISARFGTRRSRNSVIGRKRRLGLPDRVTPVRAVQIRKRVRRKPPVKLVEPVPKPVPPPVPPRPEAPMRRVEITQLARNECRWPVNDAQGGEEHLFCGRKQADGSSYCTGHLERSISKQSESARKVAPVGRRVAYS